MIDSDIYLLQFSRGHRFPTDAQCPAGNTGGIVRGDIFILSESQRQGETMSQLRTGKR